MNRTGATDEPATSSAQRAVALRGELWQRHVRLRDLDPGGAEYDDAVVELVELTDALLSAEATTARQQRTARPRTSYFRYVALGVLLLVFTVLVVLAALTVRTAVPLWALASLLAVIAALAATLVLRSRERGATPPVTAAEATAPEPNQVPPADEPGGEAAAVLREPRSEFVTPRGTTVVSDLDADPPSYHATAGDTLDEAATRDSGTEAVIDPDSGGFNNGVNGSTNGSTNSNAEGPTGGDPEPDRS